MPETVTNLDHHRKPEGIFQEVEAEQRRVCELCQRTEHYHLYSGLCTGSQFALSPSPAQQVAMGEDSFCFATYIEYL